MKTKLNYFERLTFAAQNKNEDIWNCLYDITGEPDGGLTLDTFDASQNEVGALNNYKGWKFQGSQN